MAKDEPARLCTYYNADCLVCGAGIRAYSRSPAASGAALAWRNINREPQALAGRGVTRDDVWYRLHAVDAEGRLLIGIDAFIAIWEELPAYRWRVRLLRLPVLRQVAGLGYEGLAFLLYRWNLWRAGRKRAGGDSAAGPSV